MHAQPCMCADPWVEPRYRGEGWPSSQCALPGLGLGVGQEIGGKDFDQEHCAIYLPE